MPQPGPWPLTAPVIVSGRGGVSRLPPPAAKCWPLIGRDIGKTRAETEIELSKITSCIFNMLDWRHYYYSIVLFCYTLRTVPFPWARVPPEGSPWRQTPAPVCGASLSFVAEGQRVRAWAPAPATLPTTHLWSSPAPAPPQHPKLPHLLRISALWITLPSTGSSQEGHYNTIMLSLWLT